MKIPDQQTVIYKIDAVQHRTPVKPPAASAAPKAGDRVSLSPQARELMEARRALAHLPDVREDKIAEIRGRIETGTYRIDSEAIADKMMREALSEDD